MEVNTNNSVAFNYAQNMNARLNEGGLANQVIVRGQALALPVAILLCDGAAPTASGLTGLAFSPIKFAACLVGLSTLNEAVNNVKTQAYKVICGLANIVKAVALATVTVPFTVVAPRLATWIATLGCERPQVQQAPAQPDEPTKTDDVPVEPKDIDGDDSQVIVETPVVKTGFFSKITKTHVAAAVALAAVTLATIAYATQSGGVSSTCNPALQTCLPLSEELRETLRETQFGTCSANTMAFNATVTGNATAKPTIPAFIDVNNTCIL